MAEAESVVEQTIEGLRKAIREGRYAPGQRLIIADVSRSLGVSAGPVREAFRRLTGEGLIEIVQHRGASVRSFTAKDIRQIFLLREVVEGLAARLAAENIGVGDYRARMVAMLGEIREIIQTRGGNYIRHNKEFHEAIYEMAQNERVRETAVQLMLPFYQTASHQLMDPAYYRAKAAEHELVAEAILDGDGARAERMMRSHVRNAATIILDVLEATAVLPPRSAGEPSAAMVRNGATALGRL